MPEGGAIASSGGKLQGFPTARRVICESREATWLSLNGSSGDGWGAEGINRPAKCGRAASGTPLGRAFSWDSLNQLKLRFVLWNAQAVRTLIQTYFLLKLPVRTVRLYLTRWGFTPQRPLKRAFEQQPEAVQQWLQTDYPAMAARAKAEGAEICWGDETAVSSVEHYPRGYARKGQTPVLVLSQAKRERINLISAITHQGALRFMMYRETLTADVLIQFLGRLIRDSRRKVFLILDNLRVHHSRKVKAWLEDKTDQIELFFLPSYSPELNPDEYLNADLKARMNQAEPVRHGDHLKRKVLSHLRSIQKQPERIRSYFKAENIRYAA